MIQGGSFYVALTRVREGKHVFLKSVEPSYVYYNINVEEKIAAIRKFKPYRFKKKYLSEKYLKMKRKLSLDILKSEVLLKAIMQSILNDKNFFKFFFFSSF